MSCRLDVLEHHARSIDYYFDLYPGVPRGEEEAEIRDVFLPAMQRERFDGTRELKYPRFNTRRYFWAKLAVVLAYREGRARIIPDYDPQSGEHNFDPICEACGNKVRDSRGKWICDLDRRRAIRNK